MYPQIPVELFIAVPILLILWILFTDVRFNLRPREHIHTVAIFSGLIIGFIFLYAMNKYDMNDAEVIAFTRYITFLAELAAKYDPSLICYLISYCYSFLNFNVDDYSLLKFEDKLVPQIKDPVEQARVENIVTQLETLFQQRVSGQNLIAEPLWYVVFIVLIILSIIFPLDTSFKREIDSILVLIVMWLPIVTIYVLYTGQLQILSTMINDEIDYLYKLAKSKGVRCPGLPSDDSDECFSEVSNILNYTVSKTETYDNNENNDYNDARTDITPQSCSESENKTETNDSF